MRLKLPVNLQGTKVQIFDSKNTIFVGSNHLSHHHSQYDPGLKSLQQGLLRSPQTDTDQLEREGFEIFSIRSNNYFLSVRMLKSVDLHEMKVNCVSFVHKINCKIYIEERVKSM